MTRPKVSFLIIGAQKAGTTTLYDLRAQHPRIIQPRVKEVSFFCNEEAYARGMGVLKTGRGPHGDELGIVPESWVHGPYDMGDETCNQSAYREWVRLIEAGLAKEGAR